MLAVKFAGRYTRRVEAVGHDTVFRYEERLCKPTECFQCPSICRRLLSSNVSDLIMLDVRITDKEGLSFDILKVNLAMPK